MIDKDEIIAKAKEFEIHESNVQRDYVFGWILAAIYSRTGLADHLVLTGGNALRKAYFEHSRFSRDLDFVTDGELREDFLGRELNRACEYVERAAGVSFLTEKTRLEEKRGARSNKKTYEARLYFRDFFGNPEKFTISVRLDVSQFARIVLPVQERNIIHPYPDQAICSSPVRCLKLEEILAGKLKCLLQRRHSADLYDFAFSILRNPGVDIDRAEIVRTFLQMTIFQPYPGVVRDLLINLPFQVIRGFWDSWLEFPKQGSLKFGAAVGSFKTTIEDLFGSLPTRSGQKVFFPSDLRNLIMDAGRELTLMELVYDGIPRVVEPYCLAYKTRKDGVSREYFYVYDRTRGRSSGPGIKSLLHPKVEDLRNTAEKFKPRFEVELCKAGEELKSSYFARRPGPRSASGIVRRRRRARSSSANDYPYTIECPYCRKRFKRKQYTTKLNSHSDRHGNRCYGRLGHIVST